MNTQQLIDTARELVAEDKGLLAMDESNPTCNKRFVKLGVPQTEEALRAHREWIVTTPSPAELISGVILYDETIRQNKEDGNFFVKALCEAGIIPGIFQQPALEIWRGDVAKVSHAQYALAYRAKCNRMARLGEYPAAMQGNCTETASRSDSSSNVVSAN